VNEIDILLAKIFFTALFNSIVAGALARIAEGIRGSRIDEIFTNISVGLAVIAATCMYVFISIKIITF